MRKIKRRGAFLLLMLVACAQGFGAERTHVTNATSFGRSVVLKGTWVAAAGDDPRWASPDFDDSQWTELKLGRPLPVPGFVGTRSIWYRMHVHLRSGVPPAALYVEDLFFNYSVYVNGVLVGEQGEGRTEHAVNRFHPPEAFRLPPALLEAAGGNLVIALHVHAGVAGFLGGSPMIENTRLELVSPEEVPFRQSFRLAHDWSESFAVLALDLLVGLCGLVIWWSLREQREYLALAVWLLCNVATVVLNFWAHLTGAGPTDAAKLLLLASLAVSNVAELEFMRLLLRRRQSGLWLSLELVVFLVEFYVPLLETGHLPLRLAAGLVFVRPLITEVFVGLVLLRAVLRGGNRDAPLLLLPVALWSLSDIYGIVQEIVLYGFKVDWPDLPVLHVFSYVINFSTMADVLGLLSLVLIILRRTIRLSRERADLASEVKAAEELQGLLMARASRPTPGFAVETVYRPAGQVGGDFFLVSPCEDDKSLVAIVGDVSGKGLQAAMRVSMILGVLQRDVMSQPDGVLKKLNAALLAQNEFGFTTACCVRVEADGSFCFANAGHLNPYVDGKELEAEGALPLGMDTAGSYPVVRGRLWPGQRMVLLSDGVPEARSRKGELFGFERTMEAVRLSAVAVADTAQRFGQEDDITVLTVALA